MILNEYTFKGHKRISRLQANPEGSHNRGIKPFAKPNTPGDSRRLHKERILETHRFREAVIMASMESPRLLKQLRDGPKSQFEFDNLQEILKNLPYEDKVFHYTRLSPIEREFYFGEWTPDRDPKARCL